MHGIPFLVVRNHFIDAGLGAFPGIIVVAVGEDVGGCRNPRVFSVHEVDCGGSGIPQRSHAVALQIRRRHEFDIMHRNRGPNVDAIMGREPDEAEGCCVRTWQLVTVLHFADDFVDAG